MKGWHLVGGECAVNLDEVAGFSKVFSYEGMEGRHSLVIKLGMGHEMRVDFTSERDMNNEFVKLFAALDKEE